MTFVYLLHSQKTNIYYVGITINVENRLVEHNLGKSKFTKGHRPWILIYFVESLNWKTARKREKYLKSAAGKRWLKKQNII